jgi:hypothetical protein
MLIFVSVMFELMELTFQHWLPNFNECWWDSWILDVLICNNIGVTPLPPKKIINDEIKWIMNKYMFCTGEKRYIFSNQ